MNNNVSSNISWSSKELQVWIYANLIPKELLKIERQNELTNFITNNIKNLKKYYSQNPDELDGQVTLPPPNELDKAFELQVIDKRTGKVVSKFDQVKQFELYDGISLTVKAQEIEDWKKETAKANELTKEQGSIFKATFEKLVVKSKGSISRKEIVTLIEEVRKKQKPVKVRHSGHFSDAKLKNDFEPLSNATKEKIENAKVTVKGIKLTPQEDKLINAIYKLLHDKSDNQNINSESYYSGNTEGQVVDYGTKKERSTFLRIKPSELYKEYLGKDNYSGKEITNVKHTLLILSEKKFLIQFDRQRKIEKKGKEPERLTDRIEDFQSLFKIMSYIEGMTDKEVERLNNGDAFIREQKEELILALNPLLTDQINSKYVEYPSDINQRTIIASGGALRVTESIIDLRDYLLREISAKRYEPELNKDTLINQLRLSSYAKSGRRKLVDQRIKGAIEACKKLGIILDTKEAFGKNNQIKFIFILNKHFE